jgi:hypothetical protein
LIGQLVVLQMIDTPTSLPKRAKTARRKVAAA